MDERRRCLRDRDREYRLLSELCPQPGLKMRLERALNIDDLDALARRRLPAGLYDYIVRGAEDEVTNRENSDRIKRVLIRQRESIDVADRDISTTLFGTKVAMPLAIAVTGLGALVAHDGER